MIQPPDYMTVALTLCFCSLHIPQGLYSQHFIFFVTRVFVSTRFFQPSLMFVSKAGDYNRVERLKGLTDRHQTTLLGANTQAYGAHHKLRRK